MTSLPRGFIVARDALLEGASREVAAGRAFVSVRTLYRWIATGLEEASGPYRELADAAARSPGERRRRRRNAGRKCRRRP